MSLKVNQPLSPPSSPGATTGSLQVALSVTSITESGGLYLKSGVAAYVQGVYPTWSGAAFPNYIYAYAGSATSGFGTANTTFLLLGVSQSGAYSVQSGVWNTVNGAVAGWAGVTLASYAAAYNSS